MFLVRELVLTTTTTTTTTTTAAGLARAGERARRCGEEARARVRRFHLRRRQPSQVRGLCGCAASYTHGAPCVVTCVCVCVCVGVVPWAPCWHPSGALKIHTRFSNRAALQFTETVHIRGTLNISGLWSTAQDSAEYAKSMLCIVLYAGPSGSIAIMCERD